MNPNPSLYSLVSCFLLFILTRLSAPAFLIRVSHFTAVCHSHERFNSAQTLTSVSLSDLTLIHQAPNLYLCPVFHEKHYLTIRTARGIKACFEGIVVVFSHKDTH